MTAKTHKYVHIKNQIKESIRNGSIVDKLPGERILAKDLNASYMTVRKAVAELVEEGVLHKVTTKGTFVNGKKLNSKITRIIGFFLDEDILEGISSPYYSLIFKSLEEEIKTYDYNLLLISDFNDLNPLKNRKRIDGVIICCFPRLEAKIQEIKDYLPIVLLDNLAVDKSIPSVTIDNFNSCSQSVEYLLALGHRRIGFVSGLLDSDISKDRLLGYKNALAKFGMKDGNALIYKGDYSYESGVKAGKYFLTLSDLPTAIMCANDSMAIGVMKVIQESGLNIPDDISVIGFDDILVAARVFPALTTNAVPFDEIAKIALEIIISEIKGNNVDYLHLILKAKLIKRESVAAPKDKQKK